MEVLKNRISLITIVMLLGLMVGCSGDDVSGIASGSNLDVEGVYDGIMKFTQVEVVYDDENEYYNPQDKGEESSWLNEEAEVSFTISLEGNNMFISANESEDEDTGGTDFEGTYDPTSNQLTYESSVTPGMKEVLTLRFYEEDGAIKASGQRSQELIETGWANIISIELTKRAE